MIIESLSLRDFGVFGGYQRIELKTDHERNVVLIGGKNGTGKSTLLEALRLVLYGRLSLGPRTPIASYHRYLVDRIHRGQPDGARPSSACLALRFSLTRQGVQERFTVRRSWRVDDRGNVQERLNVRRDGQPLPEPSLSNPEEYLRDLLPPGVTQAHLIDAEKIKTLAAESSEASTLAECIASLLGLDLVEQLRRDLAIYQGRLGPRSTRSEALTIRVRELEAAWTAEDQAKDEADEAVLALSDSLAVSRKKVSSIHRRLATEGGLLAREQERAAATLDRSRTEQEALRATVRTMCAGLLPLLLVPELSARVLDAIDAEEDEFRVRALEKALSQNAAESIDVLRRAILSRGVLSEDQASIHAADQWAALTDSLVRSRKPSRTSLTHDLSPGDAARIRYWLIEGVENERRQARELRKRLATRLEDATKAEAVLANTPTREVLDPILSALQAALRKEAQAEQELARAQEKALAIEHALGRIERLRDQAYLDLVAQKTSEQKHRLVLNTLGAIKDLESQIRSAKLLELQDEFTSCFRVLANKGTLLASTMVNPVTLASTLVDASGQVIQKAEFSAGEKQIYALSMLWALARTSGRQMPFVVDSPFFRLDAEHRMRVGREFFSAAGDQVVVLSTDSEIDDQVLPHLLPRTAHIYHLSWDKATNSTSVNEGYFDFGQQERTHSGKAPLVSAHSST